MTTTSELRQITAEALKVGTTAGSNVFAARTWPTWSGSYPIIWIHSPAEEKESLGRQGGPQFTVTATIRISARVQLKALPKNAAAAAMILALEEIQRQIERALINFPPLMSRLQQFPFIRSEMVESDDGDQNIGELVMDVGMEFYQGPEEFYQIQTDPLHELNVTSDLLNVVDATGTYPDPMFPDSVTPAPRVVGPDGRAEGGLSYEFPQE